MKEMRTEKLKMEIKEQRKLNIELFNSIPVPTHEDPFNKKAEPILVEWRKGSEKIKSMIKELAELEKRENNTNEVKVNKKTFVNGFGETTERNITCSTYERSEKRMSKKILSFIGGR